MLAYREADGFRAVRVVWEQMVEDGKAEFCGKTHQWEDWLAGAMICSGNVDTFRKSKYK